MNADLEQKLICSCRNGQRSAYAPLVKAYSGRIFAICLGMLANIHDAEDIAQQTLLKGFTDIGQLRDQQRFGPWASRIAKNLCIDFIRRQKRKRSALLQRSQTGGDEPKEYLEIQKALTKLSQEYRIPLMLYYFDGRNTKTIAQALGITEAAVQTRMSRARKQLREILENMGAAQ